MGFWTRHHHKILVSLGIVGISYVAYRLYDAHQSQLMWVEKLHAIPMTISVETPLPTDWLCQIIVTTSPATIGIQWPGPIVNAP
jgi:hypothetical protein